MITSSGSRGIPGACAAATAAARFSALPRVSATNEPPSQTQSRLPNRLAPTCGKPWGTESSGGSDAVDHGHPDLAVSAFLSPGPSWSSPHQSLRVRVAMTGELPGNVATRIPSSAGDRPPTSGLDARWAAWQAKGAAHDRAVRRKMAVAGPLVLLVAAALLYAAFGG